MSRAFAYPKETPEMSSATLLTVAPSHRSDADLAPHADLRCPSCSAAMDVTDNPYYGTGLAQHRKIALCTGCHNIAFIPERERPDMAVTERISGRFRSMLSRRKVMTPVDTSGVSAGARDDYAKLTQLARR